MATISTADVDALVATSPALMVVLRHRDLVVSSGEDPPPLSLGLPELLLIEALSAGAGRPIRAVVDEVAEASGIETTRLEGFADVLRDRDLLVDGRPSEPADPSDSAVPSGGAARDVDRTDALVLVTPIVLRPTPLGFEIMDHDGRVLVRLDAVELSAAAEFRQAITASEALEAHVHEAGPLALDGARLDALLARLAAGGLLIRPEVTDTGGREGRVRAWRSTGTSCVSARLRTRQWLRTRRTSGSARATPARRGLGW